MPAPTDAERDFLERHDAALRAVRAAFRSAVEGMNPAEASVVLESLIVAWVVETLGHEAVDVFAASLAKHLVQRAKIVSLSAMIPEGSA